VPRTGTQTSACASDLGDTSRVICFVLTVRLFTGIAQWSYVRLDSLVELSQAKT